MLLREWRRLNGLTLDDLARETRLSAATLSRIERGLNRPDWLTIDAIATASGNQVGAADHQAAWEAAQAAAGAGGEAVA